MGSGKSVFSGLLEAVWGFVLSRNKGVKQVKLCRKAEVTIYGLKGIQMLD